MGLELSISPTFIGRKAELRLLAEQFSAARGGNGRLCLVTGEAGIGKSRLLQQVALESFAEGVRFIRGRFGAGPANDSGRVWTRIVRECVTDDNPAQTAEPATNGNHARTSALISSSLVEREGTERVSERLQLDIGSIADNLKVLLSRASAAQPLAIVLDDLHNGGPLSYDLLRVLCAQIERLQVLVIASANEDSTGTALPLPTFGGTIAHHRIAPLDFDETGEMVSAIMGIAARDDLVKTVYSLSAGNPLLIREVLKRGPQVESRQETWRMLSTRAQAVIESRLSGLSREARRVLAVAAVIDGDLIPAVLGAASEIRSEATVAAFDELIRAGLIKTAGRGERLTLALDMAGEAALKDLPAGECYRLHRRVAEALQSLDREGTGVHSGAIASHYVASLDPSVIPDAVAHARVAGAAAIRERKFAQAVRMYSLAVHALDLSGEDRVRDRFEAYLALGESHELNGNHLLAEQALKRAAEVAEGLGDYRLIARLVAKLPLTEWPIAHAPNGLAPLLGAQVLGRLDAEADAALRASVEARYAVALAFSHGDEKRSGELGERALALASRCGDSAILAHVLLLRCSLLCDPERLHDRLECARQVIRVAAELGDYRALFLARRTAALALLETGQIAHADAEADLMKRAAALSREPLGMLVHHSYRGVRAMMEGRLSDLERELNAVRESLDGREILNRSVLCWPALVLPFEQQGRLAELEPQIAEAREQAGHLWSYTAMQSWFCCKLGKLNEASLFLEHAIDGLSDPVRRQEGYLASLAALSEVVAKLRDKERAATLYERLLPYAERNLLLGPVAVFGCASRYLGILAGILNRTDRSIAHLTHAAATNRRIGARPWAALAEFELAVILAERAGHADRSRVREICARVLSEAREMGMQKLAARAQELSGKCETNKADGEPTEFPETPYRERANGDGRAQESSSEIRRRSTGNSPLASTAGVVRGPAPNRDGSPDANAPHVFRREGEFWTLGYDGKVVRVRHRKGLTVIAHLLHCADRDFHALELCALLDHRIEKSAQAGPQGVRGVELAPLLDTKAKQSYRKRLHELRAEIEEARANNDVIRAERMEEESAYLTRELARALGIYGRDRRPPSDAERARLRVTWVVRSATNHIAAQHPTLGRFLKASIRTGAYVSYRPAAEMRPNWKF